MKVGASPPEDKLSSFCKVNASNFYGMIYPATPTAIFRRSAPEPGVEHALHRHADALLAEAWTWHIAPGRKAMANAPAAKLRMCSATAAAARLCEVRVFKPTSVYSEVAKMRKPQLQGGEKPLNFSFGGLLGSNWLFLKRKSYFLAEKAILDLSELPKRRQIAGKPSLQAKSLKLA